MVIRQDLVHQINLVVVIKLVVVIHQIELAQQTELVRLTDQVRQTDLEPDRDQDQYEIVGKLEDRMTAHRIEDHLIDLQVALICFQGDPVITAAALEEIEEGIYKMETVLIIREIFHLGHRYQLN